MPPRFLPFVIAALLGVSALADTITLKTGEKVEGKITAETDQELTVEVKVTPTISDEKKIARADVEKIEKEQPDEVAWQALKNMKPGQNSLGAAQYDNALRPLRAFLNDFPQSPHAADASKIIETFTAEKERVDAGEVRLGERWLTKEEVDKERYQIGGMLTFQYMRSQRAAGDLIGTLNTFDTLQKNYPGSKAFPDAVETARETLATLKTAIERMQVAFKEQQARFDAGLAASSAAQRPELIAARQRELAQGQAALDAATQAKLNWPVLVPRSDKNLDAITKKITPALQRLAPLDTAKLRQSIKLAEQGEKELADKSPAAADSIAQASALWRDNELAQRLQPAAAALKADAADAARTAAAEARATPKATPIPSTPRPRPTLAPDAPPEKEKPFFLTIGGIITIVVLLGVLFAGWAAYNKVRHRANDVLE